MTGNIKSRNLHGTEEHFFYDTGGLNRLTGTGPDEFTEIETYTFHDNGNIASKADLGPYQYDSQKKNAVVTLGMPAVGGTEVTLQSVLYNHFNSASEIKNLEDDLELILEYGPDEQRRLATYWDESGAEAELIKTRIYAGSYEKQTDDVTGETLEVHYISAGGMLVAIYVIDSTEESEQGNEPGKMYYPHQDHLGSIIYITDESGNLLEDDQGNTIAQSFDAWGRPRNPDDLTYNDIPERPDWLWRGYTGHEHLDEFGLINMNGRLYDPVVGRMLSPDNYVQSPDFSQSYNRYSYVWNNPLKYTDPDGEWVHLAVGAIAGGVQGYILGKSAGLTGEGLIATTLAGAGVGALSSGFANMVATGGGVMANTLAIAAGSHANSVGMIAVGGLAGVERPYSLSVGAASMSVSSSGFEFGYLGKKGNSALENVGYGFGALANVSDILMGFNKSNFGDVDLITEHSDAAGHSALVKKGSKTGGTDDPNGIISVGPDYAAEGAKDNWHWTKGKNSWTTYSNYTSKSDVHPVWRETISVNTKKVANYAQRLSDKAKIGKLVYSVELSSCVTHTSRALNLSGVLNIGIHPYLLHSQMYLRNLGFRPSMFSYYGIQNY